MFKLGLIINPVAGLGGAVGLKGSDGEAIQAQARQLGAEARAQERARRCLAALLPFKDRVIIKTAATEMGQSLAQQMGFKTEVCYQATQPTQAQDTIAVARILAEQNADIILFAGGDGTARNIFDALGGSARVLGIPAGCKIHSGVYAITPDAAGQIVIALLKNELVSFRESDVVDLDEQAFRQGKVKVKHYGQLAIPHEHQYIQQTKVSGVEDEGLVLADIGADILESYDDELLIVGSGKTCQAVMEQFGFANTLLGIDVINKGELILTDANAQQLLTLLSEQKKPAKLLVTAIGGQGHVFGRGNQQLSPEVIAKITRPNIQVVATKTKIKTLQGKPFIADTGDCELDKHLAGYYSVITGYRDRVLYPMR